MIQPDVAVAPSFGGRGFLVVVGVACLVIVGLWGLARGAPSAESDPWPPPPTAVRMRERFGLPAFPTARPIVIIRRPSGVSSRADAPPTATAAPEAPRRLGPRSLDTAKRVGRPLGRSGRLPAG
jgi:hypothetical protein